jgi:hypothetical protein
MKNDYIIDYNIIIMDTLNFENLSLECNHEWTLISFDTLDNEHEHEHTELTFNICLDCNHIEISYTTYIGQEHYYTDYEIISLESFLKNIKDCIYTSLVEIEIEKIVDKLEYIKQTALHKYHLSMDIEQ